MNTELIEYSVTDAQINEMSEKYMPLKLSGVNDKEGYKKIVEYRKETKKVLSNIECRRKDNNKDANLFVKNNNLEAKRLTALVLPINLHLTEQENIVKVHIERLKAEEQKRLDDRHQKQIETLIAAGAVFSGHSYMYFNDSDSTFITDADIWNFSDEQFKIIVLEVEKWKKSENDIKEAAEQIRKEKEAEQSRVAEEQRIAQEKIEKQQAKMDKQAAEIKAAQDKIESDKLAIKEAEEARLNKIESDKQALIQAEKDEKERLAREKRHAEEIEAAKIKATQEAKEKAEKEAKQKELDKIESDKKEKAKQAKIESLRPDKEKLIAYATTMLDVKRPDLNSEEAKAFWHPINDELIYILGALRDKCLPK